jgi:hypothetical protein
MVGFYNAIRSGAIFRGALQKVLRRPDGFGGTKVRNDNPVLPNRQGYRIWKSKPKYVEQIMNFSALSSRS